MRRAREGDAPVLGNARVDARELRERDERDEAVGRGQARVREVLRGGDGGGVRRLERREDWRRGCPRGSAGSAASARPRTSAWGSCHVANTSDGTPRSARRLAGSAMAAKARQVRVRAPDSGTLWFHLTKLGLSESFPARFFDISSRVR